MWEPSDFPVRLVANKFIVLVCVSKYLKYKCEVYLGKKRLYKNWRYSSPDTAFSGAQQFIVDNLINQKEEMLASHSAG